MRLAFAILACSSLLLMAAVGPAAAQATTPKFSMPDGGHKSLFLHRLSKTPDNSCTLSGIPGQFDLYLHVLASEACAATGAPQTKHNIYNGDAYRAVLWPPLEDAIPLVAGALVNLTVWVGVESPVEGSGLETLSAMNVQVRLVHGESSSESDWTGMADPTALASGAAWYSFEVSLPVPSASIEPGSPWVLEVDQSRCAGVNETQIVDCLAEAGGVESIGYQWYLGTEGEHATTLDLPVASGFVAGLPWPPVTCAADEELNLTTESCDPILPDCGPQEVANATQGCVPEVTAAAGPQGNLTEQPTVETEVNDNNNTTKDLAEAPGPGAALAAASLLPALVALARRARRRT